MSTEGMGPCLAVEGSTTAEVFEVYIEHSLAPELKEGQVVVMDNLAAHKPDRVRELIEGRGCENLCICRPTRRTTTPSRRLSPRSRECYGMHRHGRVGPC
jgi:transposase